MLTPIYSATVGATPPMTPPAPLPLPAPLQVHTADTYTTSVPTPTTGQEGPPGWEDRFLRALPFISLPVPFASAPTASFGDQILTGGSQVFRWMQGSAGSLYRQAMVFFTGAEASPPGWLNPAQYPSQNPLRLQVVSFARRYLGVPYVWGGETPKGFDCSGMVQSVYRQVGISLPRNSAAQARVGIPVFSRADLQPGDAVFLKGTRAGSDPNTVTHVGLYIGNGQVLEETPPSARISPFNEGKWASHKYAGARRYIV